MKSAPFYLPSFITRALLPRRTPPPPPSSFLLPPNQVPAAAAAAAASRSNPSAEEMEDYYCFSVSLQTGAENVATGFPAVARPSPRSRSSPSPRPRRVSRDDAGLHGHGHYLDACYWCERILAGNSDIFMYRGDTPFCSEDCRQQQIDTDEAGEKRSKQQSAAARREQQQRQRQSPQRIPVWAR